MEGTRTQIHPKSTAYEAWKGFVLSAYSCWPFLSLIWRKVIERQWGKGKKDDDGKGEEDRGRLWEALDAQCKSLDVIL